MIVYLPLWLVLGWRRIWAQFKCARCGTCAKCQQIRDLES